MRPILCLGCLCLLLTSVFFTSYAQCQEGFRIVSKSSTIPVTIDGEWTTTSEWSDAAKFDFEYGYFYIKDNEQYLYVLIDFIRPRNDTHAGMHYGYVGCDVQNDKASKPQPDDYHFTNMWALRMEIRHVWRGNSTDWVTIDQNFPYPLAFELTYTAFEEPDQFSPLLHRATYEFAISRETFGNKSEIGFYILTGYTTKYPDVFWSTLPNEADFRNPSTWGTLIFSTKPTIQPTTSPTPTTPSPIPTTTTPTPTQITTATPTTMASQSPDYTPYYIIAIAIVVAGVAVALAISRRKS